MPTCFQTGRAFEFSINVDLEGRIHGGGKLGRALKYTFTM
jgi:hypothetical protein